MKNPAREFFLRGMAFGGFGPIILGIIYLVLENSVKDFSLSGEEVFVAIISIYILAFVQAGASVFNQMDWPIMKSILCHFSLLYATYSVCYLINSWIPFDVKVFLIFTAIFVVGYLAVWAVVLLCIKAVSKKMNSFLN